MFIDAIFAACLVALSSIVGVFFFGDSRRLSGAEKYIIPTAVGVFLSLVLFELIPETLASNETWGGVMVATGFIAFYILSYQLHRHFHKQNLGNHECDRRSAANLLLIGDAVHNLADGVILGAAFLINPALGAATAIGLALHEIPQEIVEFGVLVRGGYTRKEALLRNLLSASTIIIGTALTLWLFAIAEEYVWVITGLAAGNLLYIAATDLLPRIHHNLESYSSFWYTILSLITGFVLMTIVLVYTHETFGHGHSHEEHGSEHHNEHQEHSEEDEHLHHDEEDHHEHE